MRLAVIGDVVQDVVVWQQEPMRHATDTRARITTTRGGSAANVAAFAARHCPTRFIGCVGDDLAGRSVTEELRSHGVDTRLQIRAATGMIVVLIDPAGERSMFPSRGASARLEAINPAWLDDVDVLHLTAYSLHDEPTAGSVLDAARQIRARGGHLSLDVASTGLIENLGVQAFRTLVCELAPDIVSANRDESALLGLTDGERPGPLLARLGDAVVLARAGDQPTRIFRHNKLIASVTVPPVANIRDTTGAGDAFNAGFLSAWLHGADLMDACQQGHALARRVLACAGAALPSDASSHPSRYGTHAADPAA